MAAEFQTHVDEMVREADLHEVRDLDQRDPQLRHPWRDRARRSMRTARSARTFASDPLDAGAAARPTSADGGRGQRAGGGAIAAAGRRDRWQAAAAAVPLAPAFVPPNLVHPARGGPDAGDAGAAGFHPARSVVRQRRRAPDLAADIRWHRGRHDHEDDPIDDKPMPLLEHLIELRRRLMWSIGAFLDLLLRLLLFLRRASTSSWPSRWRRAARAGQSRAAPDLHAALRGVLHLSRWRSSAARSSRSRSSPTRSGCSWRPACIAARSARSCRSWSATPVLFVLGAALAYYFVFPFAWRFFAQLPDADRRRRRADRAAAAKVSEYLDLVMKLIFAFGITFQMPVLLTLLAKVGIVSSKGAEEVPPLRLCRHVRDRRDPGAAGRDHADRPRDAADRCSTRSPSSARAWSSRSRWTCDGEANVMAAALSAAGDGHRLDPSPCRDEG